MNKFFLALLGLCIALGVLIYAGSSILSGWGILPKTGMIGNFILAGVTALSYWFGISGLKGKNQFAFVRRIYLSTFVKLFICAIAILIYAFLNRGHLSLGTIIFLFVLYAIYSIIETKNLMAQAKKAK